MWAEICHHFLLALSQDQGVGESRQSGTDFDRPAAGIVHDAVFEAPAVDVPCPAGDGTVDECCPAEYEDHEWKHSAALSDGTGNNSSCGGAKLQLYQLVNTLRDSESEIGLT